MPAREAQWSRADTLDLGSWEAAYKYACLLRVEKPPYTKSYRYIVSKRDGRWRVWLESLKPVKRPRGICSVCLKDVAVRRSGTVYRHNFQDDVCAGSDTPAYAGEDLPFKVCPMCDMIVTIDSAGLINSHDFTHGVECAASGEPL